MDPTKQDGKMREQVEREHATRRNYQQKYNYITEKDINKFYNQNVINDEIDQLKIDENRTYQYTGHGDSYFTKKDIYDSLVATCRCGRPKTNAHMLKCLQKTKNERFINYNLYDEHEMGLDENQSRRKLPETTSGLIGWPKSKYTKWEQSTYYVSPKYTMPGHKIDDHPYSNIFIG